MLLKKIKKGFPLFVCISNAVIVFQTRKCHLAMELCFIRIYIFRYIFPYDVDFKCLVFTINRIFRKKLKKMIIGHFSVISLYF